MVSVAPLFDRAFPGVPLHVAEAYRNAPEHTVAEILDGRLSLLPRPRPRHAKVATRLARALGGFFDPNDGDPGGWVILVEPELHLGSAPDVLDPDIAGWRRERLPEEPSEAAITTPPDWVCEILSDSTEAMDRGPKRRIYRREGVTHLWLCDPRIETIEVYRLESGRFAELETCSGNIKVRPEPFNAVELDLGRLWRW
ncbi:MAG: Uma2 family endonuclease [Polyangiaceae bacterium]|nr:Uma2 family endonuclease [Polyangiaceae bacterium]